MIQTQEYREVPVADIRVDGNVRRRFDDEAMRELVESVKAHGVLEPLLVREAEEGMTPFVLIVGERRLRAAREAGLFSVPCRVVKMSAKEAAEIQLLENLQRQDLDAIEEAQALRALIEEHGYTQEQLAERLGKSQPWVASRLRLLSLPDTVQDRITRGIVSPSAAELLVPVARAAPAVAEAVAERIERESLPVARVPEAVYAAVTNHCRPVFAAGDREWIDSAHRPRFDVGPCQNCASAIRLRAPWRAEGKPRPWCADLGCWERKQKAALEEIVSGSGTGKGECLDLDKLPYGSYEQFRYDEKPEGMGCAGCENLRQARYRDAPWTALVCLKPRCLSRKRAQATREQTKQRDQARAERVSRLVEAWGEQGWIYALADLPRRLLIGLVGLAVCELAADKPQVGRWLNARLGIPQEQKLGTTSWHLDPDDWPRLAAILEDMPAEEVAQVLVEWLCQSRSGAVWVQYLTGIDGAEADLLPAEDAVVPEDGEESDEEEAAS